MNAIEKRIDELEMRLAHQENTIGELNELVTAQWRKIEALERQMQRYAEDLPSLDASDVAANHKPPHY